MFKFLPKDMETPGPEGNVVRHFILYSVYN